MQKLMICAIRCGQSTPKVRAISWTGPPPAPASAATIKKRFINRALLSVRARNEPGFAPAIYSTLHQEECVEHDGLGEGDGQNRLDQDLRRGAGVSSDGLGGFHADQSDAERRAQRSQ